MSAESDKRSEVARCLRRTIEAVGRLAELVEENDAQRVDDLIALQRLAKVKLPRDTRRGKRNSAMAVKFMTDELCIALDDLTACLISDVAANMNGATE